MFVTFLNVLTDVADRTTKTLIIPSNRWYVAIC